MKKILFLIVSFVLCSVSVFAQDFSKRYEFKSGIIHYELSGMRTGQEILYFDQFGVREARYTQATVTVMGFNTEDKSISIIDGDWMYHVDLKQNVATKIAYKELVKGVSSMPDQKMMHTQQFSEEILKEMGAVYEGDERIVGKKCKIYALPGFGGRVSLWKGIALKFEMKMMGMSYIQKAVKIQVDVKVDPKEFILPEGIRIEEQQLKAEETEQFANGIKDWNQMMQESQNQSKFQDFQNNINTELSALEKARAAQQAQILLQQQSMNSQSLPVQITPEQQQQAQDGLAFLGALAQQFSANTTQTTSVVQQAVSSSNASQTEETAGSLLSGLFQTVSEKK